MKDAYIKLMIRQHTSAAGDEAFFEKLKNIPEKRKTAPVWKVAMIAVCILLLIPMTVLAAEYLLHKSSVRELRFSREPDRTTPGDWYYRQWDTVNMVGYEIVFDDLEAFSIRDFPRQVRNCNGMAVPYDSWNQAAEELDIGLLKNNILAAADTKELLNDFANSYGAEDSHCVMEYVGMEDQPYRATLQAKYARDHIIFTVRATAAIDHPSKTEIEEMHCFGEQTAYRHRPKYEAETYTTANGIPVTITKITAGHYGSHYARYHACFAVNNISYNICTWNGETEYDSGPEQNQTPFPQRAKEMLIEVLEGFPLK